MTTYGTRLQTAPCQEHSLSGQHLAIALVPDNGNAQYRVTMTNRGMKLERALIIAAIVFIAFGNFALLHVFPTTTAGADDDPEKSPTSPNHPNMHSLPKPVFVVGLPKVGTSSIHALFACSGWKSSHYCCCGSNRTHTHCNDAQTFSDCMRANAKAGKPILEGCGDYDVYAQLDAELGRGIYLPQHFQLDALHSFAPNATFVLNLRPSEDWVHSVTNWFGLGGRFLSQFKVDIKKVDRTLALHQIFQNHSDRIREFVRSHPSHALVEVDIRSPDAGEILANAFGTDVNCWGRHNQNKKAKTEDSHGLSG
eukprot:Nitzschia sp. Nitz4//scaffold11_size288233//112067//112993//NITZ4_000765-RA/size288233-processed-gene-0.173-mRNA-1//1//CDS//3329534047//6003//frame0